MCQYLANNTAGVEDVEAPADDGITAFERLLSEIEAMPDSEVEEHLRAAARRPDRI